jgi:transcriptional regulator with XRE-family HTH domain
MQTKEDNAASLERSQTSERLLAVVNRRMAEVQRSQQSFERELGWDSGTLQQLLLGDNEFTLRHIEELAPLLGAAPLELLREAFAEPLGAPSAAELEPEWIDVLTRQLEVLDKAGEVFQELQELIPCPSSAEVAEMRSGRRPVTPHAFLIAQLQAYMCALENVASDLKVDLEYRYDPHGAEVLDNFFNALSTAIERLNAPTTTTQL